MKRHRGFSIIELLLTVWLLGLLLVVGLKSMERAASRSGPKAAAEVLAEELRLAREIARSKGHPVALAFPTGEGSTLVADLFYRLEGPLRPRSTYQLSLGEQFKGVQIYVGRLQTGANPPASALNFGLWLPPQPEDALLAFTPSGAFTSNQPDSYLNGAYHLVVSHAVQTMGAGLNGVCNPYTVSVTPAGTVSVQAGLPPTLTGVNVTQSPRAPASTSSQVPILGNNRPPLIERVLTQPEVRSSLTPSGIDSVIPPDRAVTLLLEADDPDGDPLTFEWTSDDGGTFSTPRPQLMTPDLDLGRWRSAVDWRPPPGAPDGSIYELVAVVRDGRGGTHGPAQDVALQVRVAVFEGSLGMAIQMAGNQRILQMSPDGSGPRTFTPPAAGHRPVWSPAGPQIAQCATPHIRIWSSDATLLSEILWSAVAPHKAPLVGDPVNVSWSPDGEALVVTIHYDWQSGDWDRDLFKVNPNGSAQTWLLKGSWGVDFRPHWGPHGLVITNDRHGASSELYFIADTDLRTADGSSEVTVKRLNSGPATTGFISPDGTKLGWTVPQGDGTWNLHWGRLSPDGDLTAKTPIPNSNFRPRNDQERPPSWSPDGERIVLTVIEDPTATNRVHIFDLRSGGAPEVYTGPGTNPTGVTWTRR